MSGWKDDTRENDGTHWTGTRIDPCWEVTTGPKVGRVDGFS